MNTVEIDHVTKTFGSHTAVNDLSLAVPAGTVYGFIGPNGSGKTTTLRMIMRILHPDRGEIRVLGENRLGAANDRVGYLPEERGLYKTMKVRDILRFYAELKGVRDNRTAINDWLERLGLAAWGDRKVETLSKGMAQKVQFISAVIARPELVLLDEPFSGLDPVNAEVLRDEILALRQNGTTVIFSTHDMAVAERMCDFVFMIYRGKKVLDGTLESIQDAYGSDTVRVLLERSRPLAEEAQSAEPTGAGGRRSEIAAERSRPLAEEAQSSEPTGAGGRRSEIAAGRSRPLAEEAQSSEPTGAGGRRSEIAAGRSRPLAEEAQSAEPTGAGGRRSEIAAGGRPELDGLPGVVHITDHGRLRELRLAPGADPQAILARLMEQGTVRHFELTRPTLQDIFVRIAGPAGAAEAASAGVFTGDRNDA
jgi:ABC-2 type transport system ATP-binding protein